MRLWSGSTSEERQSQDHSSGISWDFAVLHFPPNDSTWCGHKLPRGSCFPLPPALPPALLAQTQRQCLTHARAGPRVLAGLVESMDYNILGREEPRKFI